MARFPRTTRLALALLTLTGTAARADITVDAGRGPVTVQVPPSYDPDVPVPLVMMLHGYSSSGAEAESYLELTPLADSDGFLYLHPDGSTDFLGNRFWNATDACCDFGNTQIDDSGYLLALIDEVKAQLSVDGERVFVLGHSNGGFMSYRMACDHADAIAAIASLAGATFLEAADCTPSTPVRTLQIHGTEDDTIDFGGGTIVTLGSYPGAVATTEQWATYNGCSLTPDTSAPPLDLDAGLPGAESTVTRYADGCAEGSVSVLWTIEGGAHVPTLSDEFTPRLLEFLIGPLFADGFESGDTSAWSP